MAPILFLSSYLIEKNEIVIELQHDDSVTALNFKKISFKYIIDLSFTKFLN